MVHALGRGILGSLRGQANQELAQLVRKNKRLRRAQLSLPLRLFRTWVTDRRLRTIILAYVIFEVAVLAFEWAGYRYVGWLVPDWHSDGFHDLLKDVTSYFLGGQLGVLSIVSVAVGVVTFIAQRTEGVSARADIRLYYVEAFAYEIVTSGVALVLVLSAQLFWPGQFALHLAGLGGDSLFFKFFLTAVHASWLAFNILMFFQFMTVTLRFVEPGARVRLREHFNANVIIPNDVRNRVLRALYYKIPEAMPGGDEKNPGPRFTVGMGPTFRERAAVLLSLDFKFPSELCDVWISPLRVALWSWRRRVHKYVRIRPASGLRSQGWDDTIAITASFDGEFDGRQDWGFLEGAVAPTWWERGLIRQSFRFRRVKEGARDSSTPDHFMEELADQLVGQINRAAVTSFKSALDELVRFHKFILESQEITSDDGSTVSYAMVGGIWRRPDEGWIREYRRVFIAAADKLADDAEYLNKLSYLVLRLLPKNGLTAAPEALNAILELGTHQVLALEAWFTRHTTVEVREGGAASPRLALAGSDSRAYSDALMNFVGAWESVIQMTSSIFKWPEQQALGADTLWSSRGRAWSFLQTHMYACAHFVATSVWNEDELGADRYRDMLLRWLQGIYADAEEGFDLHNDELIPPSILERPWVEVEPLARQFRRYPDDTRPLSPAHLFASVIRDALEDAITVCAAVCLSWHARGQQSGDIGARTASLLVRRQVIEGDGSHLARRGRDIGVFKRTLALVLRSFLPVRSVGSGYGSVLDTLVRRLNQMSARYVIPGRIYSGWGGDGVETLYPELLAILAANLPDRGDGSGEQMVDFLAADETLFESGDESVRNTISSLRQFAEGLRTLDYPAFERAVVALSPEVNVEDSRTKLEMILNSLVATLSEKCDERLRAAPLDAAKAEQVRAKVESDLRRLGPPVAPFTSFEVFYSGERSLTPQEFSITGADRGLFVTPQRSYGDLNTFAELASKGVRQLLRNLVRTSFDARPRQVVPLADSSVPEDFLKSVVGHRDQFDEPPILFAPYEKIGDSIWFEEMYFNNQRPGWFEDLKVEQKQGHPGGEDVIYLGTISGIDVFQRGGLQDVAILCSRTALRKVTYNSVGKACDALALALIPTAQGEKVKLTFGFSQEVEWDDTPVFEFSLNQPVTEGTRQKKS